MRLKKFVVISGIVTAAVVLYVHQHIEIIKLNYTLEKNKIYHAYLIDQNMELVYNLSRLESPRNLLASLKNEEMQFANRDHAREDIYQLALEPSRGRGAKEGLITRFLDIFTLSAEAKSRR